MHLKKGIVVVFIAIVVSGDKNNINIVISTTETSKTERRHVPNEPIDAGVKYQYMGEYFPNKYLEPESVVPTNEDLNTYIKSLKKTVDFSEQSPNDTDVNTAIGLFFTRAILKRALRDHEVKFQKDQRDIIKEMIKKCTYILSHYVYIITQYGWRDLEFRVSQLFRDDTYQVHSIEKFNRNRLKKWIRSKADLNNYIQEMDQGTLPRQMYVALAQNFESYHIHVMHSDECLSRVIYNPEPKHLSELHPCKPDPYCWTHITASPSIAYTLSHRLLNNMVYRHMRRCYFQSPEYDAMHMETLCSYMYREAVYIMRRGFFARDIFLEHIALCGLLGYEEFFRRHWFFKTISWMDHDGCIQENPNYEINRTEYLLTETTSEKKRKKIRKLGRILVRSRCHPHPMALLMVVLAHGIRYAIDYLPAMSYIPTVYVI